MDCGDLTAYHRDYWPDLALRLNARSNTGHAYRHLAEEEPPDPYRDEKECRHRNRPWTSRAVLRETQ